MSGQDIAIIADSVGWPFALLVAIMIVLSKSGWLRVILRDDRREEIEKIGSDLAALKAEMAAGFVEVRGHCRSMAEELVLQDKRMDETADKIAGIDKAATVLFDRWDRGGDKA